MTFPHTVLFLVANALGATTAAWLIEVNVLAGVTAAFVYGVALLVFFLQFPQMQRRNEERWLKHLADYNRHNRDTAPPSPGL